MNTQRATNKNMPTADFFETDFRYEVFIIQVTSRKRKAK